MNVKEEKNQNLVTKTNKMLKKGKAEWDRGLQPGADILACGKEEGENLLGRLAMRAGPCSDWQQRGVLQTTSFYFLDEIQKGGSLRKRQRKQTLQKRISVSGHAKVWQMVACCFPAFSALSTLFIVSLLPNNYVILQGVDIWVQASLYCLIMKTELVISYLKFLDDFWESMMPKLRRLIALISGISIKIFPDVHYSRT